MEVHAGHERSPGVLNNRAALAFISLFCLLEGVWSWVSIVHGSRHREDLVALAGNAFAIFITASIAYRSPFWADRVVFGAVAGASALMVVRAAPLTPAAIFAVDVAHALMWTIAACVSLALAFRASRRM